MNSRRRGFIQKELRDYIVPIVWFLIIIIFLFLVFSWWDDKTEISNVENRVWLELSLDWLNNESYIVYSWGNRQKIEENTSLYKWEKLAIREWNVWLSLFWLWDLRLNKLWELEYLENGNFLLTSSDLWLNSISKVNIDMRFAKVSVWENTNISFSQNEVESTIYLINWFAEVSNMAWKSSVLSSGQKITISRNDASSSEVDLTLLKENIDDYFKQSDWYILNNWDSYIKKEEVETSSWNIIKDIVSDDNIISFSNLSDNSNVSSAQIDILWNFSDENIIKITVNQKEASINKIEKTFKIEKVDVSKQENDLVFKVYDDSNDIISRFVYTIYYNSWVSWNNNSWNFNVKTFDVDWSKFTFSSIKDWVTKDLAWKNSYTTTWDFLTLYWNVLAEWVKKVIVNWYTLQSFDWKNWRYHASELNNNLNIWTNIYEIKYYDENDSLIYTNQFTIIKKSLEESYIDVKDKQIYSDESNI